MRGVVLEFIGEGFVEEIIYGLTLLGDESLFIVEFRTVNYWLCCKRTAFKEPCLKFYEFL